MYHCMLVDFNKNLFTSSELSNLVVFFRSKYTVQLFEKML